MDSVKTDNEIVSSYEGFLQEPFKYLCENPGKAIRTRLVEAFNYWLCVPEEKLLLINNVVEMLHTASLLVDDIEDSSSIRRGVPTAHVIYGVPLTLNCANYMYFRALNEAMKMNHPEVLSILVDGLLNLHRGQGMELYWRENGICPSETEYIVMVKQKTGGLFRLAVSLMMLFSESKGLENVMIVADLLGVHFQIRDDLMNLSSKPYMESKGFCEDLTEGKFSFPILHCVASEKDRTLYNILKQRTTDIQLKKYALDHMEKTNSIEYTRKYLSNIEEEARKVITQLGGNDKLISLLDYLAEKKTYR